MPVHEVSAGVGALIVSTAARAGVSPRALEAATGFDAASALDPDARIPLSLETALWDEGARLADDDAFGLHAAEGLRPGFFDVLDYVVRAAPTLRASLVRLARYNRLLHDVAVLQLVERVDFIRVEHALGVPGTTQSRHAAEFTLASMVVVGRQITGLDFTARAVDFKHDAPARTAEHARIFGVPPRFVAPVNALELPREVLERPLLTANPLLSRVVERHADALLAARPDPVETMANRVRRILSRALGGGEGDATLAAVALTLRMSERSVQRRLADEGVTFDVVLEELRRELALRYLADTKIAIGEVAFLLGYSEPSAFHRAFKRWTGATPAEIRHRVA